MKTLKKVDTILNGIRVGGIIAILAFAIILCAVNIVLRYLVRGVPMFRPFAWTDEVMRMCAIWVAFLAAGLGAKEGSHVSLDNFVTKLLPEKAARIVKKIAQVIVLITLAVLIVVGIKQTKVMSMSYLDNLHISNGWFYAAIPVGCGYLFYDYLLILIFGEHPFKKDKKVNVDAY